MSSPKITSEISKENLQLEENKQQISSVTNLLDKKKMSYKMFSVPVFSEKGRLETTMILLINVDKKQGNKQKKSISNNKYILFNSWYTKIRKENWPGSSVMWNKIKSLSSLQQFIDLFNFIEKISKMSFKKEDNLDEKEKRTELYTEFYRVITVAFETNNPPLNSFLYDIKLKSTGLEKLTRTSIQSAMDAFKKCLQENFGTTSITPSSEEMVSRKRKSPLSKSKKSKRPYKMVDDNIEDSQLSVN
jgi:hypothetical protein